MSDQNGGAIETREPVHEWFELSYTSYLVLPRSVLQSLPIELQEKFVEFMNGIEGWIDGEGQIPRDGVYEVQLRSDQGGYMHDPLADYERGRRIVTPRELRSRD